MAESIRDFRDFITILQSHPEWRDDLRREILTEELLNLPYQMTQLAAHVRELVEAQRHTDAQLAILTKITQGLSGDVTTIKTDGHQMKEDVHVLKTDVGVLKADVGVLKTDVRELKADVSVLKTDTGVVKTDVGDLKGKGLETHYRLNGSPFFGVLLRQAHVLSASEVNALLDSAVDQGMLSLDDSIQVRRADLVVEGKRRSDSASVYLVVEVSWAVDTRDVERAATRASLLAKTGTLALPVVAGEKIGERAAALAKELKVWQLTDDTIIEPAA
jgi:hypothetical protein